MPLSKVTRKKLSVHIQEDINEKLVTIFLIFLQLGDALIKIEIIFHMKAFCATYPVFMLAYDDVFYLHIKWHKRKNHHNLHQFSNHFGNYALRLGT